MGEYIGDNKGNCWTLILGGDLNSVQTPEGIAPKTLASSPGLTRILYSARNSS